MKTLYRIQEALYNHPWLITPSFHNSMVEQFKNAVTNGYKADMLPSLGDDDDSGYDNLVSANSGIALICVDGVIGKHLSMLETACGGVDVDDIACQLKEAQDDASVKVIAIYFNTPGGTVTGVKELGELIAQINETKTVVGYADCLCASAGYWLASQCEKFACAETSKIGSVNTYLLLLDESKALDTAGIKVNAIVGSNGSMKLAGASFKPLTDDEREMFQAQVDKIQIQFFDAVLSNRTIDLQFLNGQCFDGIAAVELGFADDNIPCLQDFVDMLNKEVNS